MPTLSPFIRSTAAAFSPDALTLAVGDFKPVVTLRLAEPWLPFAAG
ncbi:MAG: hypothetical protein AAGA96_01535 [Verrucomicrobiota bacterium]